MAAAAVDLKNQLMQEEIGMADEELVAESNGSTSQSSVKDTDKPVSSSNTDFWSNHTGIKFKQFCEEELLAFRKPFQLGWKRELVLRGTVTNSGRKIGDVYYFSPDKKIKLRSYVEMGLFLKKNSQCGLEPENFTFARQPIHEPPAEIVRPAQTRGSNQPAEGDAQSASQVSPLPSQVAINFASLSEVPIRKEKDRVTIIPTTSAGTPVDDGSSLVEGRAKRKRVAPTRFEDEEFAEHSPIKKKSATVKIEKTTSPHVVAQTTPPIKISIKPSTPGSAKPPIIVTINNGPKPETPQAASQAIVPKEKTETPKVSSMVVMKAEVTSEKDVLVNSTTAATKSDNGDLETVALNGKTETVEKEPANVASMSVTKVIPPKPTSSKKSTPKPSLPEKNLTRQFKPIRPKPMPPVVIPVIMEEPNDGSKSMVPPCSIMCGSQQGQLPSLLCSRCLCLFHPSCVPKGVYLNEPNNFVCPNCIQPEDAGSPVKLSNGYHEENQMDVSSISESSPLPLKVCSSSRNSSRATSPTSFLSSALKSRPSTSNARKASNPEQRFLAQLRLLQNYQQQTLRKAFQPLPFGASGDLLRGKLTGTSTPFTKKKQHIIKSRGGHFQIDHPMFHQSKPIAKPKTLLPPGLLSKGQHLQMSKIIQNQLQAFYQTTSIAPIAPIRVTPAQIASILDQKTKNKYRDYLMKNYPNLNTFAGGYTFLNTVLEQLTVKDLIAMSGVNRAFRSLTSQAHLWNKLRLKGITVIDWKAFGEKVVEYKSSEIDFDGIRIPPGTDLSNYWRQFSEFVPYMLSVSKLKFGTIPKSVLEQLSMSQLDFKSISIKNILDESSPKKEAGLEVLKLFGSMTSLEEIQVSSRSGLKLENLLPESLAGIFSPLVKLNSLSLTNLKGLTKGHFQFLEELSNLSSLEIGSCESWNENSRADEGVAIPYKYFQNLVRLQHLKLIEITIDESSGDLPVVMHHMKQLKSLSLESLTISPDSQDILDVLAQTINNDLDEMKTLSLSTEDPPTNRMVTELVKRLDNLDHLIWKVGTFVEDSGECVIPLSKERPDDNSDLDADMDMTNGDENLDTIDVVSLTEQLEEHLRGTKIEILPQ